MRSVIIDYRMSDMCKRRLSALGFNLIELPPHPALPEAICAHPDTLICRIGNELFSVADYCDTAPHVFSDIRELHPILKLNFTSDTFGNKYPLDCILNALILGKDFFIKQDSASRALTSHAEAMGYNIVSTRQGYPACTTLAACGEKYTFAVTSDKGMARTLSERGVKVTLIEAGGISLPPYEYGFIGGSSGVDRDKIYFAGDILSHNDGKRIITAAEGAGLECISLSSEPLSDVGGMIFIE